MAVDLNFRDHSFWNCDYLDLDINFMRFQEAKEYEIGKEKGFSGEEVNIADLLPVDPFGMDIKSTVTATKFLFQDIEEDFAINYDDFLIDELVNDASNDDSLVGSDWFLNGIMQVQPQTAFFSFDENSTFDDFFNAFEAHNSIWNFEANKASLSNPVALEHENIESECGCDPHSALLLALNYLEVEDLINVERVCKSFRDAVQGDPLLWRNMEIKQPLSLKITNEILFKLTSRAQSSLETLTMVDCINITNIGLSQVLQSNPKLTKLSVPACIRLNVEGILKTLRQLKSNGSLKVKHLRVGGLGCVSVSDFEELMGLLGAEKGVPLRPNKPQFYHLGPVYLSCDDNRPIDVEQCSSCRRICLVYDCPAEACKEEQCRACTLCIARCISCGCCIKGMDYEETFLFDLICLDCVKQILATEKGQAKGSLEMRYKVCFYGG